MWGTGCEMSFNRPTDTRRRAARYIQSHWCIADSHVRALNWICIKALPLGMEGKWDWKLPEEGNLCNWLDGNSWPKCDPILGVEWTRTNLSCYFLLGKQSDRFLPRVHFFNFFVCYRQTLNSHVFVLWPNRDTFIFVISIHSRVAWAVLENKMCVWKWVLIDLCHRGGSWREIERVTIYYSCCESLDLYYYLINPLIAVFHIRICEPIVDLRKNSDNCCGWTLLGSLYVNFWAIVGRYRLLVNYRGVRVYIFVRRNEADELSWLIHKDLTAIKLICIDYLIECWRNIYLLEINCLCTLTMSL